VSARRLSLWRTPRSRSLLLLGALAAVGGAVSAGAHLYTDLLWYRELGQEGVFWTTLKWKILGDGVLGFGTACFLFANFAVVERVMAAHAGRLLQRRLVYPVAAVVAGLIASHWHTQAPWRLLALWSGRSDFGVQDPLFHRDIGFFVFSLPLYQELARWMLETLAMAGAATIAAYIAAGGVRIARPYVAVRAARAHLLTLGALALVAVAWRFRLDQFALALPHRGSTVPGASYTDVHVRLPARRLLSLLSLAGAVLCVYAAWRRVAMRALAALVTLGAIAVVGLSALPALIERFDVQPQQLSRETPYLADAIASTRRAFALDRVRVQPLPASDRLSAADISRNQRTLDNVPLWDSSVLKPAMNELQSIGRYYSFPSSTVDRYTIDGVPQVMTVAARQLDRGRLRPDAHGWANGRFAYTHGYGVVAARGGQADAEGRPRFPQREFRAGRNPLGLRQPRIYFGEQPGADPPYVVVGTKRGEVDEPAPGSRAPAYHYDGAGGIPLSNPLRRAAFAARFSDVKLMLTETVTGSSRIVLHRDVRERLLALAPFLRWDAHPQTAVIDGRVQFIFHGYTTSSHYPYSARVRLGASRVNYVRASAQAAVDGFSGAVRIYVTDAVDPILRAWRACYPGLFLPASRMPAQMRAHLRYPSALFTAQIRAYATYHADDPTGFWNGADAWQRPLQLAGPVEGAGEIHFPDPADGADADEEREGHIAPARWQMRPDYLFARLPGDAAERLMLVMPFSPRGRENVVAYLAGSVDGDDGAPRLSLLSLPRDRLTIGPSQATRRILANPRVNDRLELLNRESRDLGRAAVNRTILGVARVVPVGDTLVYIQPVYLVAGGGGVPRLQLVTVYVDGRVGYGRDLATALHRAVAPRGR
jgi:uncharacterized membrane protein (UPF0182 family)